MPQPLRYRLRCFLAFAGATFVGLAHGAPPVASDDAYSTGYNETLVVGAPGVLANDEDSDGDALSAETTSLPLHGTLNFQSSGGFTYNPDNTFYGTDSFSYQVSDGSGVDTAVVELAVAAYGDGGGGGGGGGGYGSGGAPASGLLLILAAAALYRGLKPSKRRAISP